MKQFAAADRRARHVSLAMGDGGRATDELVDRAVAPFPWLQGAAFGTLSTRDDAAVADVDGTWAVSGDGHAVDPIEFPGGDLGSLSVHGTCNDLLAVGHDPQAMLTGWLLPEGFDLTRLDRLALSQQAAAEASGTRIVGGDTKVLPSSVLREPVAWTAATGPVLASVVAQDEERAEARRRRALPAASSVHLGDAGVAQGDVVVVTGGLAEHGAAIMAARLARDGEMDVDDAFRSDVGSVRPALEAALGVGVVHAAKDPTRGGLAGALEAWRVASGTAAIVDEATLPIAGAVRALTAAHGIDPLHLASEGCLVLAVEAGDAEAIVEALRSRPHGHAAAIIGTMGPDAPSATLQTRLGGQRALRPATGAIVPRIC